jgi:hypothetical protein
VELVEFGGSSKVDDSDFVGFGQVNLRSFFCETFDDE